MLCSVNDPQPLPSRPQFSRPTWAEINLDALQRNARALHGVFETPLLCVIKANAYGHGSVPAARALLGLKDENGAALVWVLGVASVDEGITLRENGIAGPILLLSAILPEEAVACLHYDLLPTLFTREVAVALNAVAQREGRVAKAHFKIDTGMRRLGVAWENAPELWHELSALPNLRIEGVYTHFACADDDPDPLSGEQLRRFQEALQECSLPRAGVVLHAANSAGALRYAEARFDLARAGIALYGVRPGDGETCGTVELDPVMSWHSRVTFVKEVRVGESLSYGATWRAARPARIGTVPVGYADGYPRRLGNRAHVLVRGQRVPVVGRVTMDQILLDLTDLDPMVEIGERVTLWGQDGDTVLCVEEVAVWADTIAYELLCGVGARVPRCY